MQFNRFRLFITILAAFAAFFAYVCRLNLSLVIGKMCKQNDTQCGNNPTGETLDDELRGLDGLLGIRTEAQAFSMIWAVAPGPRPRQRQRQRQRQRGVRLGSRKNSKLFSSVGIRPFAIEFDLSAGGDNQTGRGPNGWTTVVEDSDVSREPLEGSPRLAWDKASQNSLLGAFFLGYVLFQIPAGRAAEIFGAKALFIWLAIGTGLSSLMFPYAAKMSDGIFLAYAVRIIMGASQAGLFPAVYVLLCEWLPKKERSRWLAVPSAAGRIGTIVMNLSVPLVLGLYKRWEVVFYLSGLLTLLWGFIFLVFGSDSPSKSRWISDKERMFIEARMEPRVGSLTSGPQLTGSGFELNETVGEAARKPPISWLKMLTSRPLMILTLVMFTSEWSNMLLLIKLPGFLEPALGMELEEIGFWSSCLICVYCVQYPLSGVCATKLEMADFEGLSSLRVRKLFEVLAHSMQAVGCLMIAFSSHKTVVLTALFIMMLGRSTVGGGQCLMPPELSKDYPGTVMALANSFANVAGFVGPYIVTWIVGETTSDYEAWRPLWLLSAAIFVLGGLVFSLFAQNEQQNYCKRPKGGRTLAPAWSQAQLFVVDRGPGGAEKAQVVVGEESLKMDAFSRVASEPKGQQSRAPARRFGPAAK